jgi:hypothetical protein
MVSDPVGVKVPAPRDVPDLPQTPSEFVCAWMFVSSDDVRHTSFNVTCPRALLHGGILKRMEDGLRVFVDAMMRKAGGPRHLPLCAGGDHILRAARNNTLKTRWLSSGGRVPKKCS